MPIGTGVETFASSKCEPQRELKFPGDGAYSRAGDLSKTPGIAWSSIRIELHDCRVRVTKVCGVADIVAFGSKLQMYGLPDRERLCERKVDLPVGGSP